MNIIVKLALTCGLSLAAPVVLADNENDKGFGPAGLMSRGNTEDLPALTLSAELPLSPGTWRLKSGTYYEFEIEGDGSQELTLVGPEFFAAIWVDEIVVEGLEIRPMGLASIEFDEAGEMEIGFVAIRPGTYGLWVPGARGDNQRHEIIIE